MGGQGWIHRLARWSESVGVVAVWVMLVLTVIDVVGAKLFAKPLRGSIELIGFAQVVAMAGGLAMSFLVGRQIELELLVSKLPASVQKVIHVFVTVLSLALFTVLSHQSFLYGKSLLRAGQRSSATGVPFYPFAYVLGVFAAVTALYFLGQLIKAVSGSAGAEADDDSR